MFFEGSEKKAEIIIDDNKISLLNDVSDEFWQQLVKSCGAHILSKVSNEHCKAFLLSESSLFVWKDRFLIITCGQTQLVKSVEYFIEQYGRDCILHLSYQRKNEYFSQAQPSSFGDDILLLNDYSPGKAYRFGELDEHHNFIFHSDNNYTVNAGDKYYELVAYQISSNATEKLTIPSLSAVEIRSFLNLDEFLPDFVVDDFVFEPYGYSLNAIKGKYYFTIHVTPQEGSSYVSFSSNINLLDIAPKLLTIIEPASFDLLSFNEHDFSEQVQMGIPKMYIANAKVSETLKNGTYVCFSNYVLPQKQFSAATELDLSMKHKAL